MKRVSANIQSRLPPKRLCPQPTSGIVTPSASRYPVLTHWMVETEVLSSRASVGRATLTMVVSKITAMAPTMTTVAMRMICWIDAVRPGLSCAAVLLILRLSLRYKCVSSGRQRSAESR